MTVAISNTPPIGLQGKARRQSEIPGYEWPWSNPSYGRRARAFVEAVSPAYFDLLGIRLLSGRVFTADDMQGSPPVAIVDEMIAKDVFRGDTALGKCVHFAFDAAAPKQLFPKVCRIIVGVVSSVRAQVFHSPGLDDEMFDPAFYVPVAQWGGARTLLLRTSEPFDKVAGLVRAELRRQSSPLAVGRVVPLSDYRKQELHAWRLSGFVLAVTSAASLAIALVGVYASLAYTVTQRLREMGVRLALGASRGQIAALIVYSGCRPALVGLSVGVAAAIALKRVFAAYLFGVEATDPVTLYAVAVLLFLTSVLACAAPTWAASRVDPASLLRHEPLSGK
jgi:hypothetical protein